MKKTPDKQSKKNAKAGRRVRMAYALNNQQPVRCTIVSDQPLFYMDIESDPEDEMVFGMESNFMAGYETLPKEATDMEPAELTHSNKIMAEFISDATFMTQDFGLGGSGHDREFEQALLIRTLERSRLASAYMECMRRYGGAFIMNNQVETACYDRLTGCIHINPDRCRTDQILLAAKELRRLWQHRNGALLDPLSFHPDQAVLINRAQIADIAASMIRIAWELQLAGDKECWSHIEQSSMEDLGRAFAREAFLDFRTVNNGTANSAVFEAWFLSERCGYEDRKLIQQMLVDYQGYVFEANGTSRTLTLKLLNALGSMPFGKNYLSPYINTIVSDALFTEVRDRSNANFLWFIKFERTFREAEQNLQTADASQNPESSGTASRKEKRLANEKTAEIIALQPRSGDDRAAGASVPASGSSGHVIQFRGKLGREKR